MIKPSHAISIWTADDKLYAELPQANGEAKTHQICVTNDAKGLSKIINLLHVRSITSKIGEKGDPTQYQLSKDDLQKVRRVGRKKVRLTESQSSAALEALRKVGVI